MHWGSAFGALLEFEVVALRVLEGILGVDCTETGLVVNACLSAYSVPTLLGPAFI